mgnify:CR=1 FL=1
MQLYVANIAFGDWYLARLAAACDVLAHDATTADARYEALRLKAVKLQVIRRGKVIARTPARVAQLFLDGRPGDLDAAQGFAPDY